MITKDEFGGEKVKSILGRLMRKELGVQKYCIYAAYYKDISENRQIEMTKNEKVFDDMFDQFKTRDIYSLNEMLKRLLDGVCDTISVSKRFIFTVLLYLLTMAVIIAFCTSAIWMVVGITGVTLAFAYKLWEFITNRYCYVDLRIMLVYKMVLYQLIKIKSEM